MDNSKIRIESDGYLTHVWIDGERVSNNATMLDFNFHAEPLRVYCEIEQYRLDKDGNKIIKNDELLKEKMVVIDTMNNI